MFAATFALVTIVAMQMPADTVRYQVVNHGRHAGTMEVVTVADTVVVHVERWDRAREWNNTTKYVTDEAGTIVRIELRTGDGPDPVERYELRGGTARWRTPVDSGIAGVDRATFYWPRGDNRFDGPVWLYSCSISRSGRPTCCRFTSPPVHRWRPIRS